MELITSIWVLVPDIAAFSNTYRCSMYVLGAIFGGLTGEYLAAVTQPGAHSMKHPSFILIPIESHRAGVIVEPWLAVMQNVRKMITKRGKSCGRYSKLQVTME
jgi:hypothetical protein